MALVSGDKEIRTLGRPRRAAPTGGKQPDGFAGFSNVIEPLNSGMRNPGK